VLAAARAYTSRRAATHHLGSFVLAVACGSDSPSTASSTTTTTTTPQRVQLAGVWTLTETRTSVTGGECLDGTMQGLVGGSITETMTFTQSAQSITAVSTVQANGVSCNWSGTADTDRFALNLSSCQSNANQFGLRCANGATRDLRIASSGITAVVGANGNYTGTKADTYNVVLAGTTTQVGTLVIAANVTMTK
jgi:hypothetical protein